MVIVIAIVGVAVGPITGVLNQIWSKWIIILTDDSGISDEFATDATPRRPRGPARPMARFPEGQR